MRDPLPISAGREPAMPHSATAAVLIATADEALRVRIQECSHARASPALPGNYQMRLQGHSHAGQVKETIDRLTGGFKHLRRIPRATQPPEYRSPGAQGEPDAKTRSPPGDLPAPSLMAMPTTKQRALTPRPGPDI
jgi:hypothetical protein